MTGLNEFPESAFPPATRWQQSYNERITLGRGRMKQRTVAIVGLARNIAPVLPRVLHDIDTLGAMFADYRVVLYENDSIDATPAALTAHAARDPRWLVLSENRGDPINPTSRCLQRAERMAIYRNMYHTAVRERFSHLHDVIVVDTDLAVGWSIDGIANTYGHDDWDYVGSNGIIFRRKGLNMNAYVQYDAWAYRVDEAFTPFTTFDVNVMHFERGAPFVPVTCCFGGLGIYRMPTFLAGRYSGEDIDHVTLLRGARQAGYTRTFLNPSQLTIYGRHRRKSDSWVLPLLQFLTGRRPMR